MQPVNKALWFVETHFSQPLLLEDVARVAGVSPFHLTRAFSAATGQPLMRYARGRRLTVAARALANGAQDILAVALDAGYGSHEAFTRAFHAHFRFTPEQVRARRTLDGMNLLEAVKMDESAFVDLGVPRLEDGRPLLLVGLQQRHTPEGSAGIPAQWQLFTPHLGHIPGQQGGTAYGVTFNTDDEGNMDYLCAVEVADFSGVPSELVRLRIPAQRYVVFTHPGHISGIRSTWATVWNSWFPSSGHQPAEGPNFERYPERFNGETGLGGLELWIPIRR